MQRPGTHKPNTRLGRIPWLHDAAASEIEVIERNSTPLMVAPGRNLCREGERGYDEAFLILYGEAVVLVDGRPVARLTVGDICGEMATFASGERSATIIPLTPMSVLVMTRPELETILANAPTVARQMLTSLADRLGDANHRSASQRSNSVARSAPSAER